MSDGVGPLHRAVGYALGAIDSVTPELLSRPTPCRDWDLRMLLRHACESVAALEEGLETGRIGLYPVFDEDTAADPTRIFRSRVTRLLEIWTVAAGDARIVEVAGERLPPSAMAGAAALEIAVHGWDVSQACGHHRPIPRDLAVDLLVISALLVPDGNRHPLFAAPVFVAETAGPSERLIAFLGRAVTGSG
jgi:uncharacterized protein (TIGR03086 family)